MSHSGKWLVGVLIALPLLCAGLIRWLTIQDVHRHAWFAGFFHPLIWLVFAGFAALCGLGIAIVVWRDQ
jgi:hypothetical protein